MKRKDVWFVLFLFIVLSIVSCNISRENIFEASTYAPAICVMSEGGCILNETSVYLFGSREVLNSTTTIFFIENRGELDLEIEGLTVIEGDFTEFIVDQTSMNKTLAPGERTSFAVEFRPLYVGTRSLTVLLECNDPDESSAALMFSGIGYKFGSPPEIEISGPPGYLPGGTGLCDFGSLEIYTSIKKAFTISNTGESNLILYGIAFQEDDVTWFNIDTSQLKSTIFPGESTTFDIQFKPTAIESKTFTVLITCNDPYMLKYTFTIKGNGLTSTAPVPDITLNQGVLEIPIGSSVDFGEVQVSSSSSKDFSIENAGEGELNVSDAFITPGIDTLPGEFSLLAPSIPCNLQQAGSVSFSIVLNPQDTLNKTATVTIVSDDQGKNPYTFSVTGQGSVAPSPDIYLLQDINEIPSPSGIYNFGYIKEKTSSSPVTFIIENTGNATLNITSISAINGFTSHFLIDTTGTNFTLAPSGSTTFSITFSPQLPEETKWATIEIINDDPDENSYTFTGQGECVLNPIPDINVQGTPDSSQYDFGPVDMGTPKNVVFTIENTGTGDLTINSVISKDPNNFSVDDSTIASPVSPGGSTIFSVLFTPTETQEKKTTIEIQSDDPDENPYKFDVKAHGCSGPEPDINVKEGGVNFPNDFTYYFPDTPAGNSSDPATFSIENAGTGDLVINSILFTGNIEHYLSDTISTPLTLLSGENIQINIWFTPKEDKSTQTKLEIMGNDPDEEKYIIKLQGTGM